MANYGKHEYWEERYQKEKDQFDWLQRFTPPGGLLPGEQTMTAILSKQMANNCQVLIVGCGSSRMGEEIIDDGITKNIACIDSSYSVIKLM